MKNEDNKELAKRVKDLRSRKGYSQEELAEKSGLSLRTIQRIENGETEPRGDTLKRLVATFDVSPDEIVDWAVLEDYGYLMALNFSALCFIVMPLLGVLVPLVIWIARKDKVKSLNIVARDLLNFQITWLLTLFVGCILFFLIAFFKFIHLPIGILNESLTFLLAAGVAMYLYNIVLIIVNTIRVGNGNPVKYYPKIHFIKR